MSQLITVITQERMTKIQLQCHLAMERSNQSKVWKHFRRDDNDSDRASFIHCTKISCKGGSTSGLFHHVKSKHNLSLESNDQPCTSKKAKIQQKSTLPFGNVKKESLQILPLNWQLWMVFLSILQAKASSFVSHLLPKAFVFLLWTQVL